MSDLNKFLAHHGIKGMKWGVRRKSPSGPNPVKVTSIPGRKASASGGERHSPHTDAKTAAGLRQKAKKSTTDSLSNEELQTLVKRMNLEQQYSTLSANQGSAVSKFLKKQLLGIGQRELSETLQGREGAVTKTVKEGLKLAKAAK